MENIELSEKRKRIILLEDEIKSLEEKKKQLTRLQQEYYNDYFKVKRDDFSLLHDLPINSTNEKHALFDYSHFDVDTIGKIICELMKRYSDKTCVSKRIVHTDRWENKFEYYPVHYPKLIIGKPDEVNDEENENNIIIDYDMYADLKDYPTSNPIECMTSSYEVIKKRSNYNSLIAYNDGLSFNYHNLEYIKELIYSLAYYQREHNKKYMSSQETVKVYKKIYR